MGIFDFFKKRRDEGCEHDDLDELSPEEFEQAKEHYSGRLALAFESVTCQRLIQHDPAIEPLLHKSALMRHVPDWPIPSSAIVFPFKDRDNEIIYGYAWDLIESLSTEELGLELLEQVHRDWTAGKIG